MGHSQYSDLKAAWHLERIAQMRNGEQIVPTQIQLILSDLCNHDCPWCAYRTEGYASNQHFGETLPDGTVTQNPRRFIPPEKAIEILDDAAALGVGAVQFTGGGEPTVHPDHLRIFNYALSLGLECALVTNGCILREGAFNWRDILPRFKWLRVSLDAGTPETYAAIRRVPPGTFYRAISNLTALASACPNVTLGASFIVMKENWTECSEAARLAREAGASSIRFAALFSPAMGGYYRAGLYEKARDAVFMAKATYHGTGFTVIDMFDQRVRDLSHGPPASSFCGYQQFNVYIGGDLNVYRCCDTAYNDRGLVGSLKDQTLLQFWNSQAKKQAYGGFDARKCALCAFNGKNEVINYMIDSAPGHVEFV